VVLKDQVQDSTRQNHVWFEYDTIINKIKNYQLVYYTKKDKPRVVLKELQKRMGKPQYRYFNNSVYGDVEGYDDVEGVVWENREREIFYLLKYTNWEEENIRELRLLVAPKSILNSDDDFVFSGRPFYCWKDYIKQREESEDENYTYQQFIQDMGGSCRDHSR